MRASRLFARWRRASRIRAGSPRGYDRAVEALGHVGITDVICLMGFYTSVSMTLAFYDVPAGATGIAR
jgi:4-carboxymuconolactone decarboxylase